MMKSYNKADRGKYRLTWVFNSGRSVTKQYLSWNKTCQHFQALERSCISDNIRYIVAVDISDEDSRFWRIRSEYQAIGGR